MHLWPDSRVKFLRRELHILKMLSALFSCWISGSFGLCSSWIKKFIHLDIMAFKVGLLKICFTPVEPVQLGPKPLQLKESHPQNGVWCKSQVEIPSWDIELAERDVRVVQWRETYVETKLGWRTSSCKLGCARPFCGVDWISRWRGGDLEPAPAFVPFLAPTSNPCPSNGSLPPNFGC